MCRNIKPLFNFEPPATAEEIELASLQFVRKLSGINTPSRINEDAFNKAVRSISANTSLLLEELVTSSTTRNRAEEREKTMLRNMKRFGNGGKTV